MTSGGHGKWPRRNCREEGAHLLALAVAFAAALYIRGAPHVDDVFRDGFVKFQGNDPWYHMRLVDVTVRHFPRRVFYDPFANLPDGAHLAWAPLPDQLVAGAALVLGLGAPGQGLVDTVGAYFPAVLGAATVVPVYVLGREVLDRRGECFQRSRSP
ncbi:MAG: Dolichyl-monophosphooligosaccharide--protein glycotransferase AglB [Methanonatronarchaeales archaeon]|nr:Dolichyl-monophosphooligosaccharide--protein glycotransferase AglB [Methanonatronarchaeales archaeon]